MKQKEFDLSFLYFRVKLESEEKLAYRYNVMYIIRDRKIEVFKSYLWWLYTVHKNVESG